MRIVTPDRLIKTETHYFNPFCRYILSDFECDMLLERATQTELKWSIFNAWERRYGGQDLNGKRVCVYRHSAWGDQLIASAVPRYLKTLYPDAIVHMYCHSSVLPLWLGNPFVEGSAIPLPIPFDVAEAYDYHIFYEGMLEGNSERDQNNCYDDFFSVIGLEDVPDIFKRPSVFPRPEDYKGWDAKLYTPYMVYHMSPDNQNRCYPPLKAKEFLFQFVSAFPEYKVLVVGLDKNGEYSKILGNSKISGSPWARVVNLLNRTGNFRQLIPIIEGASLVVCPDSAIMHLAACFEHVPVISLWGLFHPQDRIKYYPNSYPIFHRSACPYAPCRDHNFFLPLENCKDNTPDKSKHGIKWCAALDAITPEEIVVQATSILK